MINNRNNQPRRNLGRNQIPQQMWLAFLEKLQRDKSSLYELLKDSKLKNSQINAQEDLIVYVSTEEVQNQAKRTVNNVKSKIATFAPTWQYKKLLFEVSTLDQAEPVNTEQIRPRNLSQHSSPAATLVQRRLCSPLQKLSQTPFEHYQFALEQAVEAEKSCDRLYQQLTAKTNLIATEVLTVEFPWRVRVGGTRGFEEILLPVLHPVYGVPYVPASSIKGAVRAWARQNKQSEIDRLLGKLDEGIGCVQFLDAFPTEPCLSVDMANPHWHWDNNLGIKYKPEPHPLLSMEQPKLAIGLALTSRSNNSNDVQIVKEWLKQTLAASGIGSRVSSGYGRTAQIPRSSINSVLINSYKFDLWTAGMYGAIPPSQQNGYTGIPEFRPTAVRGMLRYWFRAVALGLYAPTECKTLEAELFGAIEPSTTVGRIRITVDWEEQQTGDRDRPFHYSGIIYLEAQKQNQLTLIEKILQLSSHLGGIGRGSRRPLHWNHPYPGLRGCYWQLDANQLPCQQEDWQNFMQEVIIAFLAVKSVTKNPATCPPGKPGDRNQDVLNAQSRIYLVPCSDLLHPRLVQDWSTQGVEVEVRGKSLKLLYQPQYKGVNKQNQGNPNVGGRIAQRRNNESTSTPSYVAIQSNFPKDKMAYQAVTIFGVDCSDRVAFANALPSNSIKVWPLVQD